MAIQMPELKQVPSPNYSARTQPIRRVVFHDCQGSGRGAASYFATVASGVSAHLVVDENAALVYQCVPLGAKAWHACSANADSIGVEMGGYAERGFGEDELGVDALVGAWLLHAYGLPPVFVYDRDEPGWTTHWRLGAEGGGHADFTTDPRLEAEHEARVSAAYAALAALPALPTFALHGAPAPHAVSLPPPAPVGWRPASHKLSDEVSPPSHPTASGYPPGSAADLQWRLNRLGASPPLAVDGVCGPRTREAIATFQAGRQLVADGLMGPTTWTALDLERAA
jgi:N-acetylmuramoyl-L-alanine amidase/Putative peptidoglycan binding domain